MNKLIKQLSKIKLGCDFKNKQTDKKQKINLQPKKNKTIKNQLLT